MLLEQLIPALFCQCAKVCFQEHSALYQTPYNVMTFYLLVKTCKLVVAILACGLCSVQNTKPVSNGQHVGGHYYGCTFDKNFFYLNILEPLPGKYQ